ncbi:putative thymidylate kinase [Geobacter sp. OR-1]|uniref:dTMP kinase n=1 Tax=Geobacter sp. OR-1 TaxID=1266765 RepID=UPI0005423DAE|nr:dTMP kinase [Geobacter sp. OR-1]GAM11736.1 putative thymidylate kinase [Geobacter sp. OR-1]
MRKGKFIVVEGISGSGQQVKAAIVALHKALVELKYDVVECANPDSGRVQELGMASMINWPFGKNARADFIFEGAVRTEVFKNIVSPALEQDKIVLCKQSSISSLANAWVSGYTKHFDVLRHLDKISRGFLFEDEIFPDLTIFIDIPAEEAFERIEDVLEIHHEGGLEYYQKMREFYLKEISRWHGARVDASAGRNPDDVNADALALVKKIL